MRTVKRGLLVLVLIVAVALTSTYVTVRASLPILDGEIAVAGIGSTVSVERDAGGIVTVTAGSRADLAFGTGFAHAQDRFFQMDLTRRQAAGELAEIVGPAAVRLDKRTRMHRFRARAAQAVDLLSARDRQLLDAYVAGVNAGLASLSAKPFEYFLLRMEPEPWRAEDSFLAVYAMYLELNDERAARDVRAVSASALPRELFEWMYPSGTEWDAALRGSERAMPTIPSANVVDLRTTQTQAYHLNLDAEEGTLPGSNNWVVAGSLTASGRALLANDMHLGITTPNVFYRARLVMTGADERDTSGVTLPGAPVVVAGSNGRVAWGFTNSYGDWTDAVLVRRGVSPDHYLTGDGEREVVRFEETIDVSGGDPQTLTVRETIWGPILDDVEYPDGEVAVSWIAHYPEATNLALIDLETAPDIDAAIAIANRTGIPPQNFVVGDAEGNIGWSIAGRIPRRGGADPLLPSDWSEGGGWDGWYAPSDYPSIVNPADGLIWTANTRVTDGEQLVTIGDGGYDLGARGQQIRDGLRARTRFQPATMLEIQLDDRALFLERWRQLLLATLDSEALDGHPERSAYRDLVSNWVAEADARSVGYRLVRAFRIEVRARAFAMLTAPVRARFGQDVPLRMSNQFEGPLWQLVSERPEHLLSADYTNWREFLLTAIDTNIDYYLENFADPLAERTWGERNTAAIRHPLSQAVPFLSGWLDMPAEPLSGDGNMPRVQGPAFGASERFAVSPGDEENGYLHMPAGQSGHPLSPYYRVGHSDWVEGRASPFVPGPAQHRLVLDPI